MGLRSRVTRVARRTAMRLDPTLRIHMQGMQIPLPVSEARGRASGDGQLLLVTTEAEIRVSLNDRGIELRSIGILQQPTLKLAVRGVTLRTLPLSERLVFDLAPRHRLGMTAHAGLSFGDMGRMTLKALILPGQGGMGPRQVLRVDLGVMTLEAEGGIGLRLEQLRMITRVRIMTSAAPLLGDHPVGMFGLRIQSVSRLIVAEEARILLELSR